MTGRFYLALFLAGLLLNIAAASLQHSPGYMDADYYYAGGLRLTAGQGDREPYIWNYLNDPESLPAPSFSYWMPLNSLLAAAGLALLPGLGFWAARIPFLLLAALVPPLTSLLAYRISSNTPASQLSGFLALFPGFYMAYMPTTDAFAVYMVLGALFLLLAFEQNWPFPAYWSPAVRMFFLGLTAGLLHLTRADGLLWLGAATLAAAWWAWRIGRRTSVSPIAAFLPRFLTVCAGYVLVMAPWFLRNMQIWGSILPPGSSRAMWITTYGETMMYPASALTPAAWQAAGWPAHLQAWGSAVSTNLQTTLAVQGGIILFPFILAGFWHLRACPPVRLGVVMWLITAGLMTFVFPYAGQNGGFFHSGAALQPLLWAVAPVGLYSIVMRYARWRRMPRPQEMVRFVSILVVLVGLLLTAFLYDKRVRNNPPPGESWDASAQHYQEVEQVLLRHGAEVEQPVLVGNPPGYWLASGRPALVIPYGDEQVLLEVARKFGARYLVLETTGPELLGDLYHERVSPPELQLLQTVNKTKIYQVIVVE